MKFMSREMIKISSSLAQAALIGIPGVSPRGSRYIVNST
jgi:hypothetical protein